MDQLFLDLIGKPTLNPPKIITVVAENFSLLEDQARFLKACLAIPTVKQLPLDDGAKILAQIGRVQKDVEEQLNKTAWTMRLYDLDESICDKMADHLFETRNRSLIFVNDVSRLELLSKSSTELKKLIALSDKLKRVKGHFVVLMYQNSELASCSNFLRDLEYMSDAVVRVRTCKAGYFKSIWWQTIPQSKTLIPPKIETIYCTCKIGKFYYSTDLLCFYERRDVPKNYDLENDTYITADGGEEPSSDNEELAVRLGETKIELPTEEEKDSTLPYTQARNPEQSRIFYYPDKEDDIDEDDPDNDLGI